MSVSLYSIESLFADYKSLLHFIVSGFYLSISDIKSDMQKDFRKARPRFWDKKRAVESMILLKPRYTIIFVIGFSAFMLHSYQAQSFTESSRFQKVFETYEETRVDLFVDHFISFLDGQKTAVGESPESQEWTLPFVYGLVELGKVEIAFRVLHRFVLQEPQILQSISDFPKFSETKRKAIEKELSAAIQSKRSEAFFVYGFYKLMQGEKEAGQAFLKLYELREGKSPLVSRLCGEPYAASDLAIKRALEQGRYQVALAEILLELAELPVESALDQEALKYKQAQLACLLLSTGNFSGSEEVLQELLRSENALYPFDILLPLSDQKYWDLQAIAQYLLAEQDQAQEQSRDFFPKQPLVGFVSLTLLGLYQDAQEVLRDFRKTEKFSSSQLMKLEAYLARNQQRGRPDLHRQTTLLFPQNLEAIPGLLQAGEFEKASQAIAYQVEKAHISGEFPLLLQVYVAAHALAQGNNALAVQALFQWADGVLVPEELFIPKLSNLLPHDVYAQIKHKLEEQQSASPLDQDLLVLLVFLSFQEDKKLPSELFLHLQVLFPETKLVKHLQDFELQEK